MSWSGALGDRGVVFEGLRVEDQKLLAMEITEPALQLQRIHACWYLYRFRVWGLGFGGWGLGGWGLVQKPVWCSGKAYTSHVGIKVRDASYWL